MFIKKAAIGCFVLGFLFVISGMLVKNEFIAFLGLALWIGIVAANGLSGLLLGKFFYVYDTHNYAAAKIAYGKDHTTITGKLARVYGAVTLLIMLGVVAVLIRIW